MPIKTKFYIKAIFLAFILTSCATSDPSDDFRFDYASAEIGAFNGIWIGGVNCKYANGFHPYGWINIEDGVGKLSFSGGAAFITGNFDSQNGTIRWQGSLKIWEGSGKLPVSFRGHWREYQFKLKGRIGSKNCSGVITRQ